MKPRWERWKKRPEKRSPVPGDAGPQNGRGERPIPRWLQLAGVIMAILAAVVTVLGFAAGGFRTIGRWVDPPPPPSAQIEVSQVSLGNGEDSYDGDSPFGEQSRESMPQLHMTVTNNSSAPVYLQAVRVTVEESVRLPPCSPPQGGGPIPESKYPITLPLPPTPPGYVANYRLRERIAPGERDYPALYFGVHQTGEERFLYALKVELVTGEGKRLSVGRALLAIPGSISEQGSYLPFDEESLEYLATTYADDEATRLEVTWCFRRALESLRRLTGRPGLRSTDLETLSAAEPAPSWDRYADPRPPRAAAKALLHAGGKDAVLAAYAASVGGDADYATAMSRRAASVLHRDVEAQLRERYLGPETLELARESLALVDSPAGRELVRRAELRLSG
jgi:hypothetical protein